MADPGQIHQVIMNLVVNARDAMPDGGKVEITTTNVDVDETTAAMHGNRVPGKYVFMTVADTGIGMDEETLQSAFEPFFMRIPSDADQRSELMAITIPNSSRSPFQSDGDHRSKLMPITRPLG